MGSSAAVVRRSAAPSPMADSCLPRLETELEPTNTITWSDMRSRMKKVHLLCQVFSMMHYIKVGRGSCHNPFIIITWI